MATFKGWDGVWCAAFASESGDAPLMGANVLMLRAGALLGGDDQYLWTGSYEVSPYNSIKAQIDVHLHSGEAQRLFHHGAGQHQ